MTRDEGHCELEACTIHADGALSEFKPGRVLASLIDLITPEFFQRRKLLTRRLGSTAWLDGLRGCAAFSVCLVHLTVYTHAGIEQCYGSELPGEQKIYNTSPIVLPFIRLPFLGGHFAVMLFFTISGYVVPRRMLQCLHEGRRDDFLAAAQSSVIRRPLRLYLPVVLSTFLFASSWHILGIQTPWPKHQNNILAEWWNWAKEMLNFFYFFRIGVLFTNYNFHTWTIPVEFRGSMFLVVWLFALHTIKTRTRVLLTLGMTLYLAIGAPGAWYACFFAGMLMSELDLFAAETSSSAIIFPWDGFNKWFKCHRLLRTFILEVMMIFGLYLASEPSSDSLTKEQVLGSCRGWKTLSQLIPDTYGDMYNHHRWFWLFWASWLTLYSAKEIDWMRSALETRPAQYLGRHSFALYLVHGPMIGIVSERLFFLTGVKEPIFDDQKKMFGAYYNKWRNISWWPFSDGGPQGLEPNFLVCVAISIPIFLYVAEIGTRLFDLPSIRASKWAWRKFQSI